MTSTKNILAIVGSASAKSANLSLIEHLREIMNDNFHLSIFNELKTLPHFDPEQSIDDPPPSIVAFSEAVKAADGVIICTPEYVFSIPSGLKNALEWCVATTVFNDKPAGLITASAHGQKGHEELQLILKTLTATFTIDTALLVQGIKGKIRSDGKISDEKLTKDLEAFARSFEQLVQDAGQSAYTV